MLSKNFEYTGQRWYFSQIALPIDPRPGLGDGVFQQEPLALEHAVAQAFVGGAVVVGRLGGAGEPALVDAAAVRAQGVPVGRGQLDPLAGVQEAPRHPVGRQPQQAAAGVQGAIQDRPTLSRFTIFDAHMVFDCSRLAKRLLLRSTPMRQTSLFYPRVLPLASSHGEQPAEKREIQAVWGFY